MHFNIDEEMKKKIFVYASSLSVAVLLAAFFFYFDEVVRGIQFIFKIGFPFFLGLMIAFILHHPVMWFEKKVFSKLNKQWSRMFSVIVVFILFICILALFFSTVIPSIIDSAYTFSSNFSKYVHNFGIYADDILGKFQISYESIEDVLVNFDLVSKITSTVTNYIPKVADYSLGFIRGMINILLAMFSAFYLLLDQESLRRGIKKLNYSIFSKNTANYLTTWINDAKVVFEKYIVGSLIDSTIIGISCYLGVLLLKIPYAPMIGFVVGLTNIIPVFGPFIGAIPMIVILLLINPIYALIFAIFILILQQIDGNVIKPIVLGDQLGISGFWILFSVTIGGGLGSAFAGNIGGVFGMFLGVPIFAIIYAAVRDFSSMRLQNKHINVPDGAGTID